MSWVTVWSTGKGGKGKAVGKGNPCPTQLREGDWNCAMCNQHNFAFRKLCKGCQFPAPVMPGQKGQYSKGNDKGSGKGKTGKVQDKGKGKGVVPGSSPSPTQSRNARSRAAKKLVKTVDKPAPT